MTAKYIKSISIYDAAFHGNRSLYAPIKRQFPFVFRNIMHVVSIRDDQEEFFIDFLLKSFTICRVTVQRASGKADVIGIESLSAYLRNCSRQRRKELLYIKKIRKSGSP